ncbi:MAG: hypothetical protein NTZ69_01390 [Bacteroidia bacterium]|nr:hypothetical protein [Bacteroidia bacterium]
MALDNELIKLIYFPIDGISGILPSYQTILYCKYLIGIIVPPFLFQECVPTIKILAIEQLNLCRFEALLFHW